MSFHKSPGMLTFNGMLTSGNFLRKFITGLTIPQEYLCLSMEKLENPLCIFLTTRNKEFWNITSNHLFLGYRPLIMAIVIKKENEAMLAEEMVCLNFVHGEPERGDIWNGYLTFKNPQARLILKKMFSKNLAGQLVIFYQGYFGEHYFINPLYQNINKQRGKLRKSKSDNISLPGNLYDQVRIAYSVPRIIALMTVSDGDEMNIFPTDLHGPCGNGFYISSLRLGGKANDQIEQTGRALLAFMPVNQYKAVYTLGKNHMKNMAGHSGFPLLPEKSRVLKMPIPAFALKYYELKRLDSFDAGIHRIHIFHCLHKENISNGHTLAHIHQYYAQWRLDQNIPLKIFFR